LRLVVGLGNPGERYRRTRHNVGFMVVDALAARIDVERDRDEPDAWVASARLGGVDVRLVKPLTFMNRSGVAVEKLAAELAVGPGELLVVVDDVALELGSLRIRERGSHGGHNGLRSLIDVLGTDEFPRVRVGIRRGEIPEDVAGYVLSEFPREDVLIVQEVIGRAAEAVECVIREGAPSAMNRYNRRV
jgi:PTH1 family peptidyl-tRNA hydrolase